MEKRIITYSLLAHINNGSLFGTGYEQIFIPLVKRGLAMMCGEGQFKGKSILEIKAYTDGIYGLDMPIPLLKRILRKIQEEINSDGIEQFIVYNDGSFIIKEFVFDDYEEEIKKKERDLEQLDNIYQDFRIEEATASTTSVFEFVETNKKSLGKYIGKKYPAEHQDLTTEARFVNFIKNIPGVYTTFQTVYLGSIISTYLEFEPSEVQQRVELLLDTNFIISLLDLNTAESTHSCRKLVELAKSLGYSVTVLDITIQETEGLLSNRIGLYDTTFLSKLIDPEDIFNACERRKLNKTDLEKTKDTIENELTALSIHIVSNSEKYRNRAKFSTEYEKLQRVRNTPFAALHDATCYDYVKTKRGNKTINDFNKVPCWFVNNSSSKQSVFNAEGAQPIAIKGEDLLNMLWLTSPAVKNALTLEEFTDIGLTRLISATLNDALPQASTIRELDNNIRKYAQHSISDEDIVRVSKSIAQRTIKNIEGLNKLASDDPSGFVGSLQEIANEQKSKEDQLRNIFEKLVTDLKSKVVEADNAVDEREALRKENLRLRNEQIIEKNSVRKVLRDKHITNKICIWRIKAWIPILLAPSLIFLYYFINYKASGDNLEKLNLHIATIKDNPFLGLSLATCILIYNGFFIKKLSDRHNQSAINAFESKINIPADLKDLPLETT